MKKVISICLVLFCCFILFSCSSKSKTNYFTPKVENKYESISYEDFINAYLSNININHDYFSAEVNFKEKINQQGMSIEDEYYVGMIDKEYFSNYITEYKTWVVRDALYKKYMPVTDELNIVAGSVYSSYNFTEDYTYTTKPYSVSKNNVKVVFDDSFYVSSIIVELENNKADIKFNYFNESDLYSKSGKINRDTYHDIAAVKHRNQKTDFTKVAIKYECKNTEFMDGEVIIYFNIILEETAYSKGYKFEYDHYEVLDGDINEKDIYNYLLQLINPQMIVNQSFLQPSVTPDLSLKTTATYSNNPLSVKLKDEKGNKIEVTFNDEGFPINYLYKRSEGPLFKASLSYS